MFVWLTKHKILTLLLLILAIIVIFTAFSNYIDNEISKAIHTEASDISQCKTMPVGHKACGGPAGYIMYSAETSDIDRYLNLVATRNKLRIIPIWLIELISGPTMSNCSYEMPRKVEFANGKCFFSER